jgi:hypothetical protein
MKKTVLLALLLFAALSCADDKSAGDVLKFEARSNCSIVGDCAARVEVRPLLTGGEMVGEVMLCKETPAGFVVVDYDYNIFIFNKFRELQKKICRKGRGPQEYLLIDDVDVDSRGNVYVLTMGTDVLVYAASGDFVARHALEAAAASVTALDDGRFCFTLCHEEDAAYAADRLLFTDAELNPLQSALPLRETTLSAYGFASEKLFHRPGAPSCLYFQSHDKLQYRIDPQGNILETYVLDFGEYATPEELLQSRSQEEMVDLVMKHDLYYVNSAFENRNFLLFNVIFQQGANVPGVAVWIYDKRSRKSYIEHYPNENSPLFQLLQFPVWLTDDDAVWYLCDNEMLRDGKEEFTFLQDVDIPSSDGVSLLVLHLK